jgi:hypothetical protein
MASSTGTCRHPPLPNHPDKTNWIEKYGGLPREVDCVARALHWGSGKSVGKQYGWRGAWLAIGPQGRATLSPTLEPVPPLLSQNWTRCRQPQRGRSS